MAAHFQFDGKPVTGMTGLGTFAEELIVGEPGVVKIDSDVPLDIAALIGCGVTTGVGAWFPLRLHCPPEIAVLEVRSGEWNDPTDSLSD